MYRKRCVLLVLAVCSLLAGCDKLWPAVTAADEQAARHAMPISEVSLMVRNHYDQNKIIAEIERRHVPVAIDAKTEESLIRFGAKPALIAALKNEANVLTRMQKQAFDELAAKRGSAGASERDVAAQTVQQQDEPRTVSLQQSLIDTPKTDTPEEAYWKAEAAYRAKKSDLEARIFSEQGRINRLRNSGAHESDLASAEARLHQYENELKNLRTPMR